MFDILKYFNSHVKYDNIVDKILDELLIIL